MLRTSKGSWNLRRKEHRMIVFVCPFALGAVQWNPIVSTGWEVLLVWQAGGQGERRLSRKRREAVWDGDKGKDECSQFLELSQLVFGGEGAGWDAGRRNTWQSWWQTWVGHANWHYQPSYISFHSGKQSKKKVEEITLFILFIYYIYFFIIQHFFCNETFLIFCNEMSGEEASLPADALSFPLSSLFQVSSLL